MTTKICPSCRGNSIFSGLECDICGGFGGNCGGAVDIATPCNGTIPDYPCHQCQGKGVVVDDKADFGATAVFKMVRK